MDLNKMYLEACERKKKEECEAQEKCKQNIINDFEINKKRFSIFLKDRIISCIQDANPHINFVLPYEWCNNYILNKVEEILDGIDPCLKIERFNGWAPSTKGFKESSVTFREISVGGYFSDLVISLKHPDELKKNEPIIEETLWQKIKNYFCV